MHAFVQRLCEMICHEVAEGVIALQVLRSGIIPDAIRRLIGCIIGTRINEIHIIGSTPTRIYRSTSTPTIGNTVPGDISIRISISITVNRI
jgi:hypothetical protein